MLHRAERPLERAASVGSAEPRGPVEACLRGAQVGAAAATVAAARYVIESGRSECVRETVRASGDVAGERIDRRHYR